MINTSQLQIGSWVMYNGQPNVIESIKSPEPTQDRFKDKWAIEINPPDSFFVCLDELEPIPLTTDWLERAGYKNIGSGLWDNGSEYDIDFYENGSQLRLASSDDYVSFGPVFTYLHELQLLMTALGRPITFDGK